MDSMDPSAPIVAPQQPSPQSQKAPGYTLGLIGVICSSIFFVPLLPLVGIGLGIGSIIKSPPGRKTLGITAVAIGAFTLIVVQVALGAIATASFTKYIKRSKTTEATMNMRRLGDGVLSYQIETGKFPATTEWTPPTSPCGQPGDKFAPNAALWSVAPWTDLHFEMSYPFYYQYRLVNEGDSVKVQAKGDLNCDNVSSLYERKVSADGVGPLHKEHELE